MTTGTVRATISSFSGNYRFLSNFYTGYPFYLPILGCAVPTSEHGYQALKPLDLTERDWILAAPNPGEAKHRGRRVTARADWDQSKRQVMMEVVLAKFARVDLRGMLVATGRAQLIEGNHWGDDYWGAVPDTDTPVEELWIAADGSYLSGHNWLGRILMTTRELVSPE